MSKGTVLITGASGFVGSHLAREALERGYSVRATARSDSSAKKIASMLPEKYASSLSYAIVPDMTVVVAYKGHLDGVVGVLHAASPFVLHPEDNLRDTIDPAIQGAVAILEAALRFGPDVKRVVITSSHAACLDPSEGLRPGYVYSEKDWNPVTYEEAAKMQDGTAAYVASKTLAERAAWDFMEKHKADAKFDLATICPPWIYGPYVIQPKSSKGLSESIEIIRDNLLDKTEVPGPDFAGCADVRDVAAAHVSALEVPEAGGQRFWVGQNFNYQRGVDALRSAMPEIKGRIPEGTPGVWVETYTVDGSKTTEVLGVEYRGLGVTLKDMFGQLLELEKTAAAAAA